jgi:hypothetical protein
MDVESELRVQVERYVSGQTTIRDLRNWLAMRMQELADSRDDEARALEGLAWLLIGEHDVGDYPEEQIRSALREELGASSTASYTRTSTAFSSAG